MFLNQKAYYVYRNIARYLRVRSYLSASCTYINSATGLKEILPKHI